MDGKQDYVSRNRSAKALRLICSFFAATSVNMIWSALTPFDIASAKAVKLEFRKCTE